MAYPIPCRRSIGITGSLPEWVVTPAQAGPNFPGDEPMADSKVGSSVLVGLIAFIAVSAWLAVEVASDNPYRPNHVIEPRLISDRVATGSTMIPVSESLSASEALVTSPPPAPKPVEDTPVVRRAVAPAPAPRRTAPRPVVVAKSPPPPVVAPTTTRTHIIVEERRLSQDDRIRLAVMDRLAASPHLNGKIGVEAKDAVVRLTGWTRTVGQARHAEREARSVRSVKHVQNEIRPRVGGSV